MVRPKAWLDDLKSYAVNELEREAARRFALHQLGPMTPTAWKKAAAELRRNIWESFGTVYDGKLDLDYREHGTIKCKGYSIKKVTYQSRPGFHVTANLYIPDGKGPFPAIINMHGHWAQGKIAAWIQQMGHMMAQEGYVVLIVDAWGSGERCSIHGEYEYHGNMLGLSILNIGESLIGVQVVDNMRGVDLLSSLNFVDASRIGATGGSGGGNQTMWLAAMDERVKAAVPVVSVGTFQSYVGESNCTCELLPDGLTYTEESGILALVAPRAIKPCNNLFDVIKSFYPAEMLRSYKAARQIYQSLGADSQLSYGIFNRPHGYWPEIMETALGFFDFQLKGEGNGAPRTYKPFTTLPEEDMLVFPVGKRPAEVKSIAVYCDEKGGKLRSQMLKKTSLDVAELRNSLADLLRLDDEDSFFVSEHTAIDSWRRFTVESGNKLLPLLLKEAKNSSNYKLFAHPDGAAAVPETDVEAALKDGYNVLLLDLSDTGQTAEPALTPECRNKDLFSRGILWLGGRAQGEWVQELETVCAFLVEELGAEKIAFAGYRECCSAMLFAAAFGRVDSLDLNDAPLSYQFYGKLVPEFYNMSLPIPGVLQWGDLSLAAALSEAEVKYCTPRFYNGELTDKKAFKAFAEEYQALKKKLGISHGKVSLV